jgi:hypothetical protein
VAILWTYHRPYDDLIVLLPVVALVRSAAVAETRGQRLVAAVLAGALMLFSLERPQGRHWITHGLFNTDVDAIILMPNNLRLALWVAALAFLLHTAHRRAFPKPAGRTRARVDPPTAFASPPALAAGTRRWILVCVGAPALILVAAYAWLAIDRQTANLWPVIVHESGRYTLGQTILYFHHFLREIPTIVAMSLFVVAACGSTGSPQRVPRWLLVAPIAAVCLMAGAFAAASVELGVREAILNLNQLYTRDDLPAFGSHWRFHLHSTLWFGLAAPVVVRLGRALVGAPAPPAAASGISRAAWIFFWTVTVAYGLGTEPFIDPRYIGHQAREIFTHATITLPLGLGAIAFIRRAAGVSGDSGELAWPGLWRMLAVVAIPAYLALAMVMTDSMAEGQTSGGLSAMVGAHYFEHVLDYLLAVSLVAGLELYRLRVSSTSTVTPAL